MDEIEKATIPKRHKLATMMLVKLVNKHDTAVDYLDGGMESLLEKGLRMQHHGITLASRNLSRLRCCLRCDVFMVYWLSSDLS